MGGLRRRAFEVGGSVFGVPNAKSPPLLSDGLLIWLRGQDLNRSGLKTVHWTVLSHFVRSTAHPSGYEPDALPRRQTTKPAAFERRAFDLVAGAGFEPAAFRL